MSNTTITVVSLMYKFNKYVQLNQLHYTCKNEQLDQCCRQLVAMLCCTLSTTVVNNCSSQLLTVNNQCSIIVDNHQQAFFHQLLSALVPTTLWQHRTTICQHRTTIDRTILINIGNSTSAVEP